MEQQDPQVTAMGRHRPPRGLSQLGSGPSFSQFELEVNQASLALGGKPVLRGIDLALPRGQVLALLGASGCGKTTLLRAVAGLTALDQGRIAIGGRDVTGLPAQQRGIGVVFQHYALFPNLSVLENIKFGVLCDGHTQTEAEQRGRELLALVGLQDLADRLPARLSGGQRQRVALARALARQPSLLLMDEPFSALDESFRVPLRRAFRQLQRRLGQSCLLVTHDREEAFELADQVAVMFDGQIVQVDAPSELWKHPASRRVADFLGAFNAFDPSALPAPWQRPDGHWLAPVSALTLDPDPDTPFDGLRLRARLEAVYAGTERLTVQLQDECRVHGPLTLWAAPGQGLPEPGAPVALKVPTEALAWVSG